MNAMRPPRLTILSLSALLGLALAGVVMPQAPARAQAQDEAFDTKIIRGLMKSLGLKSADDAEISYEPRPPLVIPSDDKLPPPQTAGVAASNPAWPKDPDVRREKVRKELSRDSATSEAVENDSYALRPDQMTPGAKYESRTRQPRAADPLGVDGSRMTPGQLGYTGGLFKNMFGKGQDEDSTRFVGEPPRTTLTEPPPGYQTPSPNQPYGVGHAPAKAEDNLTTRGEFDGKN
jgi:hypothetical protein